MKRINCTISALVMAAVTVVSALAAPTPTQQAYVKASNAGTRDEFGWSVAVSGDTTVIGAHYESSNATGVNGNQTNNSASQSGAVYVFVRNGSDWIQQAYLKASNTGASDEFGWSVAISEDTVVVGAPFEDSSATGVNGSQSDNSATASGAAYVFVRNGTNWVQQAYLKASNTGGPSPGESVGDTFGWSVAVSGDTVVVGANGEDSNATGVNGNQNSNSAIGSGAAYVFVRNGTNWVQQAYLKPSNTGGQSPSESYGDAFGGSVGVSGDTIVVGADGEDSNATGVNGNQSNNNAAGSGAAYVFVRNGTNWIQQAYLKASNTGNGDEFGFAVAISGDTVVAGAAGEASNATGVNGNQSNNSVPFSGAAYVFVRDGTNWIQQAYLKASYISGDDGFGFSVAVSGDVLVAGAPGDDSNATGINGDPSDSSAFDAGAAYVFTRDGTNWSQRAYLKASNTGGPLPGEFYGDNFGADGKVAVSGDTVVVGAHAEDSNGIGVNGNQTVRTAMDSGAAYVFTGLGPSAPQLAIEQSAGNVRISWPLAAADFVLDEAGDLNASATLGWAQVPFPYQTNATHISITLPLMAGNKFYRLRKLSAQWGWQSKHRDSLRRFALACRVNSTWGMDWRERLLTSVGPGLLGGITCSQWFRLLRQEHLAVDPSRWPRALSITLQSLKNSAFNAYERHRYGSLVEGISVEPPLFVLGHWRSGTTHLHQLLAQDRRFAFPNGYQTAFPHTFLTTEARDSRFLSSPDRSQNPLA